MDKRFKAVDEDLASSMRQQLYKDVAAGAVSVGQAVRVMRRISHLTQPEFAKHRGISVQALKQIEQGTGNPTVATLDKVASIFGLRVGFVPIGREPDRSGTVTPVRRGTAVSK